MIEVFRSSVNTWECDRMGHLNVRHYFARANDGLAVLLLKLGLGPSQLRERGWILRARDQHVRFTRELRPGAAFTLHAGVVSEHADGMVTYQELRNAAGEVSATILTDLTLLDVASLGRVAWPQDVAEAARQLRCDVPAHGAPRGVSADASHYRPSHADAVTRGLIGAFLGPLLAEDCDARGVLRESACMARVADGIGHFFRAIDEGSRPTGIGGAAVEYRYVFHEWPRQSDVIEVRSGLKAVGNKTLHMNHFIFNVETGRCVAASEAIAVWFDLTTRKAVEVPAEVRAEIARHIVANLSL